MYFRNKYQKILSVYVSFLVLFWIILFFSHEKTCIWIYFYSFAFSLVPLIFGVVGCFLSKKWGFLNSAIGSGVFFISLGSFFWGGGSMIWSYYNLFENISAPYPSLADIGFILSIPLWVKGIISLSRATGARNDLKSIRRRLILLVIPVLIIIISYYLLIVIARDGILIPGPGGFDVKLFLDLAYPIGDIIILSLALIIYGLSFNYLGGLYKRPILTIFFGFGVMYFADFIFSYTTTMGTFYNGNLGDLAFTLALSLISFGTLGLTYSEN